MRLPAAPLSPAVTPPNTRNMQMGEASGVWRRAGPYGSRRRICEAASRSVSHVKRGTFLRSCFRENGGFRNHCYYSISLPLTIHGAT